MTASQGLNHAFDLLERADEIERLKQWYASVIDGGCVALIGGEAGVGKSSLVKCFAHSLPKGTRILWGGSDPLGTPHPFGPLHDIARDVGGPLQAALHGGTREAVFAATLNELDRLRDSPLLVFEDVHWADQATLDLLKFLGRRIGRTRAMLLVTFREDEVDAQHPARAAFGNIPSDVTRRLHLRPLSERAVETLAKKCGRNPTGLYAATFGNPFYVTEVLASESTDVPHSVRDAVLARLATLSDRSREVAQLASVIPGRTEVWLARKLLSADEAIIDECRLCGMDRDASGALHFRHEISRRAVEDSLPADRRRSLHVQILEALQSKESGIPVARLVHHAVGAMDADAARRYGLLAAKESAGVAAHHQAIAYCQTALQYPEQMSIEMRIELLGLLAYECYLTDKPVDSLHAWQLLLAIHTASGDELRRGDALRWMSRISWFCGRGFDAQRYGHEAVHALEPLGATKELAMAYSNISQLAMLSANTKLAIEWGEKAIELARTLNDNSTLSHALNNVGSARTNIVGDRGWRELEESLALALQCDSQEHAGRAYTNLVTCAISRRAYEVGTKLIEVALAYCDAHELDAWGNYIRAWRSRSRLEQADWNGALQDARALLRQPNVSPIQRIPALVVTGSVQARRGEPDARDYLVQAIALAEQTNEVQRVGPAVIANAEWAYLTDDSEALRETARNCNEQLRLSGNPWSRGNLAFWAWRGGMLDQTPENIAEPFRLQLSGAWQQAARAWEQQGCRYEQACALAESRDESDRLAALALFDELGARPMAARLRKQFRAEGIRGVKRGAQASTRANPGCLTSREVEILKLLATGQTNAGIAQRLSISTKTVGHHVSAILEKLSVATRSEAVSAARKLGIGK